MVAAIVAIVTASPAFAGEPVHPTEVLKPTAFGVTPPLSEIPQQKPAEGIGNYEIPNREVEEFPTLPGAIPADQIQGEGRITLDSGILAPAPSVAFDALNSDHNNAILGFRVMPPDTQGAVGLNYYVQWINLVWQVFNKSDGTPASAVMPGNSLWAAGIPGTDCANENAGDPITLFDHQAQRWFMSQFTSGGSSYEICLAVSQTSDPTGAWYTWEYSYGTQFPDYPKFGVWPDGYYMTVNEFGSAESATTVFDRAAMVAGNPAPAAQYFYIDAVQPAFPQPTNLDGVTPPPAGAPNYNLAFYDDAWGNPADIIQICDLTIDWAVPGNSAFTCPAGPGDPGYLDLTAAGLPFDSDMCGGSRNCVPQPGTSTGLDTLANRFMFPANYRNLMGTLGYEVMVLTHTVDVDGTDHAGIRWYELRNTGAGWFVNDGGTFAPDSDHRFMGSAAVDQNGNIGLVYSISSSSTFPSVGYTARDAADPAGSMQTEVVLVAGGGSQEGGNRWGDYAAMHVDPDGCTFWGTAEYVNTGGSFIWDTYVGSFTMPGCTPSGFGTMAGTVTNSATTLPIEGALVEVGAFSTFTMADGSYGINVPVDTYDVTASAFGFSPSTAMGIEVFDATTTTQDFVLDPVGSAFIDGYVTGAVHGWPLYARIDVDLGMLAPVATVYTNPFNGYYLLELPQGAAYDMTVTSLIAGYDPAMRNIVLGPAGQTESFALMNDGSAAWVDCYLIDGIDEDFEGSFPPGGWSSVDNIDSGNVWTRNDEVGAPNRTLGSGFSAAADPSAAGGGTWDTTLFSPTIGMPATPALGVRFASNFQDFAGNGDAWFDISSDGGVTWTNLWFSTSDDPSGGVIREFDVSAYAGMTIQLRWQYAATSSTAWYWQIDDVQTYALPAPPPPPIQSEDFESWPPAGWTNTNNAGCGPWESTATTLRTNFTGGSGDAADADSDWCGSAMDTDLDSPVYDLTGVPTVFLAFEYYFDALGLDDIASVDVSADGGATWTNVAFWDADVSGSFVQDISGLVGGSDAVQVRFHYTASGWNWYFEVDDFALYDADPVGGTPPTPPPAAECVDVPGSLVEGFVYDANTTDAINGASVTDDIGGAAETMPTPDDPGIADGFYYMFTPLPTGDGPSTRTFTASSSGYADSMVDVNLVPNTVNQLDFALGAGWLEVTPTHLDSRLFTGETEDQLISIINHGTLDANVSLLTMQTSAMVPSMPMDEIPQRDIPAVNLSDRTAAALPQVEAPEAAPLAAGDVISSWPHGLTLGWGLGFNKIADNVWVSNPGAGGGDDLDYEFTRGGTATGNTLDTSSWMGAWAADMAFDPTTGMVWQLDVGGAECIHEWDPVSLVTTGNTICWGSPISERGLAYDPVSDTFFVGGWNTTTVTRFDRSGTVLNVAAVGLGISGLAYNPVTEHLFVMVNASPNPVYVLDVADNYNVIGTFAIPGFGDFSGAGLGFSCDGHLWAPNQGDAMVYEVDSGENAACIGGGGLPWLELTPTEGMVPANEGELPINAQFIADGTDHFGLFQANIMVNHDTPYDVNDVTVCFTKAFNDMPVGTFGDAYVHSVAGARITGGCGLGNFCPTDAMTRGVMARWLINSMFGPDYTPPPCVGIFADVVCESTSNSDYIEALFNEGVTAGCNADPLLYCPDAPVLRSQMAVFLLKALEGAEYGPPPCAGIFTDVSCPDGFAVDWIEEFFNRGITAGCGVNIYCPTNLTSRAEMSVFEQKTFDFPMCGN